MLEVSGNVMAAFQQKGLKSLRASILAHWHSDLRGQFGRVSEQTRALILANIDAMSNDDPTLTVADLTMLADLMLVDADNQLRLMAAR
jgi:hypothetical protein